MGRRASRLRAMPTDPDRIKYEHLSFDGGMAPDDTQCPLPAWYSLENLWIDPSGKPRSRPHLLTATQEYANVTGVFRNNAMALMYVADGQVSVGTQPVATISGDALPRYDFSRLRTIVTIGGKPLLYTGPGDWSTLPHENVRALATFVGAQKLRLVFVKNDDPHRLYVTTLGDLTDTGTLIPDYRGNYSDTWTEGFSYKNIPHEIMDICELNNQIFVFTRRGIYTFTPDMMDGLFVPDLSERMNVESLDHRVWKEEGQIFFLSTDGPKRLFFEDGYPTFSPLPLEGLKLTIRDELVNGEAAICFDKHRRLLYLMPDRTSGKTYVFNLPKQIWTVWDIAIEDCVVVFDRTYVTTPAGKYVYRLDEIGDGHDEVDVKLRTGLTPLFDMDSRKRIRAANVHYKSVGLLEYYIDSNADEFIEEVDPVYGLNDSDPYKIVEGLGDQGQLFSLVFCFRTRGQVLFNQLMVELLIKKPRVRF